MLPSLAFLASLAHMSWCQDPLAREISNGMDWLTRYGYLPPPDPRTGQLQTLQAVTNAIKLMQRFGGIKQTGEIDQATLDLMKKPRCSLPDIVGSSEIMRRRRRRYALSGTSWKKNILTWRVNSYPSRTQMDAGTVRGLLSAALRSWESVSPLQFREEESGDAPDIRIEFQPARHGDGYPFDGPQGTLAHAFFPGEPPISGDTHFDNEETWTYNDPAEQGTDLFAVAVHEFGHAIGLAHSSARNSIMRPYYEGSVGAAERYQLPPDDVYGIEQLYGKRERPELEHPREEPNPPPRIPEVPYPSSEPRPEFIDRCTTTFDAVANIRGEAFFFKDHYFWRMQRAGNLVSLNPAKIGNFWHGLPSKLTKIDSVYERPTDNKIVFFIRDQYWVFTNTEVEHGYPRPISDFGLILDRIDAVFVWPSNGKTYLFRGGEFWRYDEQTHQLDAGYPKQITLWKGIGANVDGVMAWSDGYTYFFRGSEHWRMESGAVEVQSTIPHSTAQVWMHCDAPTPPERPRPGRGDPGSRDCSCDLGRNAASSLTQGNVTLLSVLLPFLTLAASPP